MAIRYRLMLVGALVLATALPARAQDAAQLNQMMAVERQDFGVPARNQLHAGAMHGPTPASIPGGQLITTKGLVALVQGRQAPYLLVDVLGQAELLPGALQGAWLSQPGAFNDAVQQQAAQWLGQHTQGRKDLALVFYCQSRECWMSYNAALRAIQAGYRNVLWYRGGVEAWKAAGLPMQPQGQGQQGSQVLQGQHGQRAQAMQPGAGAQSVSHAAAQVRHRAAVAARRNWGPATRPAGRR